MTICPHSLVATAARRTITFALFVGSIPTADTMFTFAHQGIEEAQPLGRPLGALLG